MAIRETTIKCGLIINIMIKTIHEELMYKVLVVIATKHVCHMFGKQEVSVHVLFQELNQLKRDKISLPKCLSLPQLPHLETTKVFVVQKHLPSANMQYSVKAN